MGEAICSSVCLQVVNNNNNNNNSIYLNTIKNSAKADVVVVVWSLTHFALLCSRHWSQGMQSCTAPTHLMNYKLQHSKFDKMVLIPEINSFIIFPCSIQQFRGSVPSVCDKKKRRKVSIITAAIGHKKYQVPHNNSNLRPLDFAIHVMTIIKLHRVCWGLQ